ncbi:MAG: CPBP family intramembrane metalloprotease [Puniceicoccales bacterium]|jgi:membrane protease YdiL (CAAX protease family)|nr:CPBP family intramembrane metalloprotease [Puniceicoccales bacterium]
MNDSPAGILLSVIAAIYLGNWWWRDFRLTRAGAAPADPLPGAFPCAGYFIIAGTLGAVVIPVLETVAELVVGVSHEQSNISILFLGAMLSAAVIEEVIFRGYIVVQDRGRGALIASIVVASFLFSLMHDYLWQYQLPEGVSAWEFWRGFSFQFTPKGWVSFSFVFTSSLYFYALRFHPRNIHRSLFPCFVAHAAKNIAIFIIKFAQGHVVGWW